MGAVLRTAGRGTWFVAHVLLRVAAGGLLMGIGGLVVGGGVWALLQSGGLWEAMGGVLFAAMGIAVIVTGVLVLLGLRSVDKPGGVIRSPSDGRHGAAYYGAYGGSYGGGEGLGGDCGGSGFGGGGGGDGGGGC